MNDRPPLTFKGRLNAAVGGFFAGLVAGLLYGLFGAEPFYDAGPIAVFTGVVFAMLCFVFGPRILWFLLDGF